jgi:hypothetical protein
MANDPKDRNAPKSEGKPDSKMPAVDTVTEKMDTETSSILLKRCHHKESQI